MVFVLKGCPERRDDLEFEELDGEYLVFDPETDKTYNFNGTGSFIWSLANGEYSIERIIDEISHVAPDTSRETIESDVKDFVKELTDDGLLTLRND